ncbi:PREDICTED: uncharacterized protein LOC106819205 [Priapulus caudatus]|uniref:Uncharacterized protein LOC106819205 n=1 Tax=Priapulus caudatus TaxID=37621 RepID=A0ABM1F4G7_PRICU|nr:PREDICTED: uncharacterized protein LOC106819205 [Priapulus caudatus]
MIKTENDTPPMIAIILLIAESGGVQEIETDAKGECSLADESALELGNIGIQVEKSFSDARDIEFALKDGQIYLLQARPITSLNMESEYELMHEQDSPLLIDDELYTNANTGEMMPQAMTPLTLDAFVTNLAGMGQIMRWPSGISQDTYMDVFGSTFCKHVFLNMYSGMYYANEYTMGSDTKGMKNTIDILLFGGCTGDEYLEGIHKRYRTTYVPWYRKFLGVLCLYTAWYSHIQATNASNIASHIVTQVVKKKYSESC